MIELRECIICGLNRPLNARGECGDCVFKKNHGGKTKQQIYAERKREKDKQNRNLPKMRKPKVKKQKDPDEVSQLELDEKTYYEVFLSNSDRCEECGNQLPSSFRDFKDKIILRAQYSHILAKKPYPEFRNDKRNFNRLCFHCHYKWDFGDKESMKIFGPNQVVIQTLLDEKHS